MSTSIDLNADVGEGFPYDDELMTVITSANVACGFHAGDATTMAHSCASAAANGVAVGAQVSYRDREGFGRRAIEIATSPLVADLSEQIVALAAAARDAGIEVSYLKPHGALYNRAVWDDAHAAAVVISAAEFGLPMLGLPGSRLLELAASRGLGVWSEFFADRAYHADGTLVARSEPGAVVGEAGLVVSRLRQLVTTGTVTSIEGDRVAVRADSVCIHGDTPDAASLARTVRTTIESLGIDVASFVRR